MVNIFYGNRIFQMEEFIFLIYPFCYIEERVPKSASFFNVFPVIWCKNCTPRDNKQRLALAILPDDLMCVSLCGNILTASWSRQLLVHTVYPSAHSDGTSSVLTVAAKFSHVHFKFRVGSTVTSVSSVIFISGWWEERSSGWGGGVHECFYVCGCCYVWPKRSTRSNKIFLKCTSREQ